VQPRNLSWLCEKKVFLLLDYLIRWDYIHTCGYRIRLEVLQTAANRGWCDRLLSNSSPINRKEEDGNRNSTKETTHMRRARCRRMERKAGRPERSRVRGIGLRLCRTAYLGQPTRRVLALAVQLGRAQRRASRVRERTRRTTSSRVLVPGLGRRRACAGEPGRCSLDTDAGNGTCTMILLIALLFAAHHPAAGATVLILWLLFRSTFG